MSYTLDQTHLLAIRIHTVILQQVCCFSAWLAATQRDITTGISSPDFQRQSAIRLKMLRKSSFIENGDASAQPAISVPH
jgi:hypothetical protein